jgi:hypothetical protein
MIFSALDDCLVSDLSTQPIPFTLLLKPLGTSLYLWNGLCALLPQDLCIYQFFPTSFIQVTSPLFFPQ